MALPKLLTSAEVCEILRCSRATIYRLRDNGALVPLRVGKAIRYRESDVLALIDPESVA